MKKFFAINRVGGLITGGIFSQVESTNEVTLTFEDNVCDLDGKAVSTIRINAESAINNPTGYLCAYFAKMLKNNADFESFSIGDGESIELSNEDQGTVEQVYLNGIPVSADAQVKVDVSVGHSLQRMNISVADIKSKLSPLASSFVVETVKIPAKFSNEYPCYVKNNNINKIFFESGVALNDEKIKDATKILSDHMNVLKIYLDSKPDGTVVELPLHSLSGAIYHYRHVVKSLKKNSQNEVPQDKLESLFRSIDRIVDYIREIKTGKLDSQVFGRNSSMIVRIGKGWIE